MEGGELDQEAGLSGQSAGRGTRRCREHEQRGFSG